MKKTTKTSKKTAKKVVKKAAAKKATPKKKPAKKAVARKPAAKKAGGGANRRSPQKAATAKKTVASRRHEAGRPNHPVGSKKTAAKKPVAQKFQRAVVTTVLPPKLSVTARRVTSSTLPAQSAVKAPKPPQSKHVKGGATDTSGRKRLNKEELKYFENLLNEKKETLIQELDYIEDNSMRLNSKEGAGDLSSHAYHLADHATETQDREQAFHLASREGRFLYYIEEALDRVRAGTFGICKKCGTLIPKARLEAVPTAKMCINCKSLQEHAIEGESVMA